MRNETLKIFLKPSQDRTIWEEIEVMHFWMGNLSPEELRLGYQLSELIK